MIDVREPQAALRHHLATPRTDVVIVANRLPVTLSENGPRPSPGGLVAALNSVVGERSQWVGWAGADSASLSREAPICAGPTLHPVAFGDTEVSDYYDGFCNSVLWPLFHGRLQPPDFKRSWWNSYVTVNQRFATVTAQQTPLGGRVWVHDYHLLLVPRLLRELRPDLSIGLFLHIPFPAAQIFEILPWRADVIAGMLGADLIGFQTSYDAENFRAVADRQAARSAGTSRRHTAIGVYPISVDFARWNQLGSAMAKDAARKRQQLRSTALILGVDRLDYTKGISRRIEAFAGLLDDGRLSPDDSVLVQIAVPTRGGVDAYSEERTQIESIVRAVNERHPRRDGLDVVNYQRGCLGSAELASWYRAADVMLVTPLADGMNLVAKEYVASRSDVRGALVLSEFAGAAQELAAGAELVNPYDCESIKQAIMRALTSPSRELSSRMSRMRSIVEANDVERWAADFLEQLDNAANRGPHAQTRAVIPRRVSHAVACDALFEVR